MAMKRQEAVEIPRSEISFHDELPNPRTMLNSIEELAVDIRENGLTYGPLVWRTGDDPVEFYLLDGWRRMAAIEKIREGFKYDGETYAAIPDAFDSVPAVQWEGELQEAQFRIVGANIQRDALSNLEMADSLLKLAKHKTKNPDGFTNREIARRIGKSETWVSRVLSFAKGAEAPVKEAVLNKEISEKAAHKIAAVKDPVEQVAQLEIAKDAKKKGQAGDKKIARAKGAPSSPGKKVMMEVAKLIPQKAPTDLEEGAANGYEAALRFAAGEISFEESFLMAGFSVPEGIDIESILGGYVGPVKAAEMAAEKKANENKAKAEKKAAKKAKADAKKAEKAALKKEAAKLKKAEKAALKKKKAEAAKKKKAEAKAEKAAAKKEAADAQKAEKAAAKAAKKKSGKARKVVVTNDDATDPVEEDVVDPVDTPEQEMQPDAEEVPVTEPVPVKKKDVEDDDDLPF